ncbi:MAG: hypothetical protein LKG19_00635 [Saprospiraceae bacterium]|jgi:hypothetical protein|nr:hypothetical protein [Saprospiraceae bacterium]
MTVHKKYTVQLKTIEFDPEFKIDEDLYIADEDKINNNLDFDKTTILTINDTQHKEIKIRVDWCNYSTDMNFHTLLIEETDKLLIGPRFFWAVINLNYLRIERQEYCAMFWNFEKHSNTIIVTTELEALALDLNCETKDTVPIDPPFDIEYFENRIEFTSLTAGKQTLNFAN